MSIRAKVFARIGGSVITQYTLASPGGLTLRFLTFGARVQQVRLPAGGADPNLILGFITLQDYLDQPGYFGAVVGPTATAPTRTGWQNWNWRAETAEGPGFDRLTLTLTLGDGADGHPGARTMTVTHTLGAHNDWHTTTRIETTQPIAVAPSAAVAWQLSGDPAQTILGETLTVGGQPLAMPSAAQLLPAPAVTLRDRRWALDYATTAPALRLDPLAAVGPKNNFNGVLGQPHVGLKLIPQLSPTGDALVVAPGAGCEFATTATLRALTE